jgi:uncharacterized protein
MRNRVNLKHVLFFYVLSVTLSAPFRLNLINLPDLFPMPFGLTIFFMIFLAVGPLTAFLAIRYILKNKNAYKLTLGGNNKIISWIAICIIPVCLTVIGVEIKGSELNAHYIGFLIGLTISVYALFEEVGWRGYLQNELQPVKLGLKILLISVLWYLWHLNFLKSGTSFEGHIIHFLSIIGGSIGLYYVSIKTNSLLIVAAVHSSFNLFELELANSNKLIVLVIAIAVWIICIRKSAKKNIILEAINEK